MTLLGFTAGSDVSPGTALPDSLLVLGWAPGTACDRQDSLKRLTDETHEPSDSLGCPGPPPADMHLSRVADPPEPLRLFFLF